MISFIYNILPRPLKRFVIGCFKLMRIVLYRIAGARSNDFTHQSAAFNSNYRKFQQQRRYGPLKHFCYAPHTSMFFSLHGNMAPCYATYGDKSDVFGEITIAQSWFHGSFETIRYEHAQGNFDSNCSFCSHLLKQKAYGSMLMQKYEHYAFSKSRYPAIMEFELSNRCKLECIMCDNNLSSSICNNRGGQAYGENIYGEMFLEQLQEFIPHLRMAEFTGGDPFMIDIYYKIFDMIIENNPKCDMLITTNANTMNSDIENLMAKTRRLHFNISIDAVEKSLYEQIRKNGNFETAMRNIEIFSRYCKKHKTSLNLLVCPMNINSRNLPMIVEFGNSLGAGVFFHTVVKPAHLSLKYCSPHYLTELVDYLKKFSFRRRTWNQRVNANNWANLIQLVETWQAESQLRLEEESKQQPTQKSRPEQIIEQLMLLGDEVLTEKLQTFIDYISQQGLARQAVELVSQMEEDKLIDMLTKSSYNELVQFITGKNNPKP